MAEDQNRKLTEKFVLRLPDGMRDRIRAAADANNRSMNAEILARLDQTFYVPDATGDPLEQIKAIIDAEFAKTRNRT